MRCRSPRKFNPQLMPKEELYETFVAREGLLEDLLKQIKDQTQSPSVQHYILIAPRGMGKTNLMQMIKYRILDDPQMDRDWLPLVFAEEEFEIYGIRSFFEKIIDLVFETNSSETFQNEFHNNKSLEDDKIAVGKHIEMIQTLSDRLKKQFIVFVDNLDLLLMEQLPEDLAVKKLRTFLTTKNSVLLFGGAIKVFDEILSYNKPLFSHFAPIELSPFKDGEIETFIKERARYENNDDILNNFDNYKPKIKAVSDLTGGNPRLVLILYDILSEKNFDTAAEILVGILDDLTTYYQDILKGLPPKERKLLDTILRSDIKLTSTNLSSKLRWKQNEISSLLKRLKERQIVKGKKATRGREVYYETTDSVFRIFYQMRYLSKQRKRLRFIVDFLQEWYSREELTEKIRDHKYLYEKYISEASKDKASEELEKAFYFADASLKKGISNSHIELIKTCIFKGDLTKAMEELEEWNKVIKKTPSNKLLYLFIKGIIYGKKEDHINALKFLQKGVEINSDISEVEINSKTSVVRNLIGKSLMKLERFEEAICSYTKAIEIEPKDYEAWISKGVALGKLKKFDEEISSYKKAVEIKPDYQDAWNNLGVTYVRLNRFEEAILAFKKVIEIEPDDYKAWFGLGILHMRLNHFSQSLKIFKDYLDLCKKKGILHKDLNKDYLQIFYNQINSFFTGKEKSKYFFFFRETLEIIKSYKMFDVSIPGFFFLYLLKNSEYSFFNDCFEEVKTVLGEDTSNKMIFFKTAALYLETKDIATLERLNQEDRKPVELIIETIEKSRVSA